jgi:hypothetical protein
VKHLNILLVATLFVYAYRDFFPLITYRRIPLDLAEGWVLWAKSSTLFVAAVIVPLFIPRQYIAVDPKNPMPTPSPEQTASIISTLFYFFLDPIVFLAYRVPHLPRGQLLAHQSTTIIQRSCRQITPPQRLRLCRESQGEEFQISRGLDLKQAPPVLRPDSGLPHRVFEHGRHNHCNSHGQFCVANRRQSTP